MNIGTPVKATDPDRDTLEYSLGGTDAASFSIVTSGNSGGQLQTKAALNYESKDSYSVTVTAEDPSTASDEIDVTISVTNVNESGRISLTVPSREPGTEWSARVSDPDGITSGSIRWIWQRSPTGSGGWTRIPASITSKYTVTEDDVGHWLRVSASYNDGAASNQRVYSTSVAIPPRVTIEASSDSVNEGSQVVFIVTSTPSSVSNLTVGVRVTPSSSDVLASALQPDKVEDVVVSSMNGTGRLALTSASDNVDEAAGSVDVEMLTGTGVNEYLIGADSSASVTVTDDDDPPQPTELRANGHVEVRSLGPGREAKEITLIWEVDPKLSEYTSGYRAHFVLEECHHADACRPQGGIANPMWSSPVVLATIGSSKVTRVLVPSLGVVSGWRSG